MTSDPVCDPVCDPVIRSSARRRDAARLPTSTPAAPIVALLLAATLGGCGFVGVTQPVEQTETDDARVSADVKSALIATDGIDAAAVRVAVEGNTVTLDGFVASEEERATTLEAARSAAGALEVVDQMEVRR